MQKEEARRFPASVWCSEAVDIQLIVIWSRPALHVRRYEGNSPHELSPKGLQVCARYPPRGGIGKFARAVHESDAIEGAVHPRCSIIQM